MKDDRKRQEQPESAKSETSSQSTKLDVNRSHTPIIISGGSSVKIYFEPRDYPANSNDPAETTHTHRRSAVGEVNIIDDKTGSIISSPAIPSNGRCTVTVICKRTARRDSNITISGDTNLKLSFEHQEFLPLAQASAGSHFNQDRKITGVEVQDDNPGGQKKTYTVPKDGRCTIKIFDRHLP